MRACVFGAGRDQHEGLYRGLSQRGQAASPFANGRMAACGSEESPSPRGAELSSQSQLGGHCEKPTPSQVRDRHTGSTSQHGATVSELEFRVVCLLWPSPAALVLQLQPTTHIYALFLIILLIQMKNTGGFSLVGSSYARLFTVCSKKAPKGKLGKRSQHRSRRKKYPAHPVARRHAWPTCLQKKPKRAPVASGLNGFTSAHICASVRGRADAPSLKTRKTHTHNSPVSPCLGPLRVTRPSTRKEK